MSEPGWWEKRSEILSSAVRFWWIFNTHNKKKSWGELADSFSRQLDGTQCSGCDLAACAYLAAWAATWGGHSGAGWEPHRRAVGVPVLLQVAASIPAGSATFLCSFKTLLLSGKSNGFQLWLLGRYFYNKVIALGFKYNWVGFQMDFEEVFLWLEISAQQGEIKEVKRRSYAVLKHWHSGPFPI